MMEVNLKGKSTVKFWTWFESFAIDISASSSEKEISGNNNSHFEVCILGLHRKCSLGVRIADVNMWAASPQLLLFFAAPNLSSVSILHNQHTIEAC
jgi:hypothetical protein